MRLNTKLVLTAFAAAMLVPAAAMAAGQDSRNQGYLVDNNDKVVVTSGFGLCWRDSDWTPARSAESCDSRAKPIAASEPAPVVLAAAQTVPDAEPAKPLPQKICSSGDALFAFDKSDLSSEGKTMLESLAHQLEGANYDKIFVTGHTDRFGSDAYNQKLSERRAQTVKSYLVSLRLDASRIIGVGKGETQSVTKNGQCLGAKSAKVIACLQPDRRVDVELSGARTIAAQ